MISQERLKEVLVYNPNTGIFIRKSTGMVGGSVMTGGYLRVRVNGKAYLCHRLAWLYTHGSMPTTGIDHINGIKDDNRIINLRQADQSENGQNHIKPRNNKSGHPGVSFDSKRKKWKSKIKLNGEEHYLGMFDSAEAASVAYVNAKHKLHPFFNGFSIKEPL